MLSTCPLVPLQLAPPEACFYLPGQPSDDSALTGYMHAHTHTNTYTHTYIYRHTLPLIVSLWGLGRLCSHGFPFLLILCVLWYEDLQMCFGFMLPFTFTLTEGLTGPRSICEKKQNKKANAVLCLLPLFLSRTSNLYLVLCYHIIVLLDSIQQGMTEQIGQFKHSKLQMESIPAQ